VYNVARIVATDISIRDKPILSTGLDTLEVIMLKNPPRRTPTAWNVRVKDMALVSQFNSSSKWTNVEPDNEQTKPWAEQINTVHNQLTLYT